MHKDSLKICFWWPVISSIIAFITSFAIWSSSGALLMCNKLPVWMIFLIDFGYWYIIWIYEMNQVQEISCMWFWHQNFLKFFYFFFWPFSKMYIWFLNIEKTRPLKSFLLGLSYDISHAISAGASFFSWLRISFFFAFAITLSFSARACRKFSQFSMVSSLFQIFSSVLFFICLSLQSLSKLGTDFRNSFLLWIADVITVSIALVKNCTFTTNLFAIWELSDGSLMSFSQSTLLSFWKCILWKS